MKWSLQSVTCNLIKQNTTFVTRLLLFTTLFLTLPSYGKTLKIAAIDWCPQICLDKENPGYVVEIVKEVFRNSPYQIEIDYYPWSRAIKYVNSGVYDALLSPAKKEAPHLTYPEKAVGHQKMCFFTSVDSKWQYRGPTSLSEQYVGVATDTSIEELNDYIKHNPERFQFQPYHERYVKQNAGKVLKGRIDSFIFTLNTTNYILDGLNMSSKFKNAGCVSTAPIYIAFTPIKIKENDILRISQFWDQNFVRLKESGFIDFVMAKYNIH